MRPVQDRDGAPAASHTPIYDTLCAEYLRAFRALPGDRTGEEDLAFTGFSYGGSYTTGTAAYGASWSGSGWQPEPWQPPYAPAPAPAAPQPSYAYAGGSAAAGSTAYAGGRQHQTGMQHIPAALPPAPRRGY
ncbi:hypothetical protein ACIQUV_22780 [Streptomyces globosus]|uniref:hypothetical protein n=1 Tax=Streptomyces TaxID=1883 RepID=UPI00163CED95|nr:hypothetical protein [Streptomyces sp. WAC05292]